MRKLLLIYLFLWCSLLSFSQTISSISVTGVVEKYLILLADTYTFSLSPTGGSNQILGEFTFKSNSSGGETLFFATKNDYKLISDLGEQWEYSLFLIDSEGNMFNLKENPQVSFLRKSSIKKTFYLAITYPPSSALNISAGTYTDKLIITFLGL